MPTSFQNKTYNVLVHAQSTLCRLHSSLYKEKTAKKWRNKALLRWNVQCTQCTLSIRILNTFSAYNYMFKITMTLVCTISIGNCKVFNRVLNFISVLSVLMYNSVLMCNNVLMYNSVLMYGSVITNPGKNATNQTRTKCHRIRMHQNCKNKSYNSVTKV